MSDFCTADTDGNCRVHCLHDVHHGDPSAARQVCCHCGDLFMRDDEEPHGEYLNAAVEETERIAAERDRLRAERDELRELVADLGEYLEANTPADGWGCLDRGADSDRKKLLERVARIAAAEGAGRDGA